MGGWIGKLRRWLAPPEAPGVPFRVVCRCGREARGQRRPHSQSLRCGGCQRPQFVLPLSPLPPVTETDRNGRPPPPLAVRGGPRLWLLPLAAGGLTLLVVVAGFGWLLQGSWVRKAGGPAAAPAAPESIPDHLTAARRALAEGSYQVAARELDAARALLDRNPRALSAAETRQLNQLQRQAVLLKDLLMEPLEEVLRHAAGSPAAEWQGVFASRYEGRAVIFDAEVRRDAAGQFHIGYRLRAGFEPARLELGDLKLLRELPLHEPQRLVFGARLAGVRREEGRGWVVRLRPDSGVLLTDPGAVASGSFQLPDAGLLDVLRRQGDWVEEAP